MAVHTAVASRSRIGYLGSCLELVAGAAAAMAPAAAADAARLATRLRRPPHAGKHKDGLFSFTDGPTSTANPPEATENQTEGSWWSEAGAYFVRCTEQNLFSFFEPLPPQIRVQNGQNLFFFPPGVSSN